VDADGRKKRLTADDFELTPTRYWESPSTGSRYPVAWTLSLPAASLALEITARVDAQEMPTTVRYWEGAVAVAGDAEGVGYLEMTGY
jgi:predicted secreted hydrolase